MTATPVVADVEALASAVDAAHDLLHQLDTKLGDVRTLLDAAKAVETDVRAAVPTVEHVAEQAYDAIVALGKDGFSSLLHDVKSFVGKPADPVSGSGNVTIIPAKPTTVPPTSDANPAPVDGTTETSPSEEAAPVDGAPASTETEPPAPVAQ